MSIRRFNKINFSMTDNTTVVEVLVVNHTNNGTEREWRHKEFDENISITDIVNNHLRLALNWDEGKNDKNGKEESAS